MMTRELNCSGKRAASGLLGSLVIFALSACNGPSGASPLLSNSEGAPVVGIPAPPPAPVPGPSATPAPPVDPASLYSGPAEVAPYVQKFVEDATLQGRNVLPDMSNPQLTIQLSSLASYGSSVIGLCESGGNMRRVTFSPSFWNSVDDTQRELLVHHELGHCVLYRAHLTTLLPSGAYASIMYPIIMTNATYLGNHDYYQQELFGQAPDTSSATTNDPNAVTTFICNLKDLMN